MMNAEPTASVSGQPKGQKKAQPKVQSKAGLAAWRRGRWPTTFRMGLMMCIFFSALIYLPSLTWTFGHDQNVFAEIGSLILKGKLPYINAWDIKPPNIYYVYAIAEWIGGRHEIAIRAADYLSTLTTSILLYLLLVRVGKREKPGYQLGLLASLLFTWIALGLGLADTAQTESFSLPFLTGAMLSSQYRDRARFALLAGALIAIATFFKTTNILFVFPFLIDALMRHKQYDWKKSWLSFICGFALASAIELLFMAWQGFLGEYLKIAQSVFSLHGAEQTGSPATILSAMRIIGLYSGPFILTSLIGLLLLLFSKKLRDNDRSRTLQACTFAFSFVLFAIVAVLVQRKGWGYHYVILLPGLLLFLSLCTGEFFRRVSLYLEDRPDWFVGVVYGFIGSLMVLFMPMNAGRFREINQVSASISDRSQYLATMGSPHSMYYPLCTTLLSKYLIQHTTADDNVFILGQEPGAYWKSDRIPATRYIYTLLFTSPMMTDARFAELNSTLIQHPPKLITVERFDTLAFSGVPMTSEMLLQTPHLLPLKNLLAADYVLKDTVCEKFLIYIRKS